MNHTRERHANCRIDYCALCDGGLFLCSVCGCAEGTLTTECSGALVDEDIQDAVHAGRKDFRGGEWVELAERAS